MLELDFILPRSHFNLEIKESLPPGITGIFGPSGSGKTSFLNVIAGMVNPVSGKLKVDQKTLFDSNQNINVPIRKRNIGYVFQEGRLFPHMTVAKNLKFGMKKDLPSSITFEAIVDMLKLGPLLHHRPSQISGGEQQRVALGRALLSSPDILLLDEPFSALDIHLRDQILPFIREIGEKVKIPILVVSHDLSELLKLTHYILCLKEGRCVGHGSFIDLLKNPESNELFGSRSLINSIEMTCLPADAGALNTLRWTNGNQSVDLKCERSSWQPNRTVRVFIHADDISLSSNRVDNITIQNQIKGRVDELINRDQALLCIVDVGFKLIVEITHDSKDRLGIEVGKSMWCLFKSVAIGLT